VDSWEGTQCEIYLCVHNAFQARMSSSLSLRIILVGYTFDSEIKSGMQDSKINLNLNLKWIYERAQASHGLQRTRQAS
jgi:hypothetical protein